MDNLASRTINSLKWTYLSVIITSIIQVVYTAVMARLLDPFVFGLVAMANVVISFGSYLSRMGIGPALIRKPDLCDEDIKAGFTLSLIFGFTIYLIICISAPLVDIFFHNADVIPILRVLGISLFVTGLSTTATSLMRRKFLFRQLSIVEIASFSIGTLLIGIPLAYLGFGVWSLVASTLVQGLLTAIGSYYFVRHPVKLSFDRNSYRLILGYGGKLSFISILEYLYSNIDTFLIGRTLGSTNLGIYNRSGYLVNLPSQQISTGLNKVLFSTVSEIQDDKQKLKRAYLKAIFVLGIVLFPFTFGISGGAREIVLIVLGLKWTTGIPVLRILSFGVAFNLVSSLNGIVLDAVGALNRKILIVIVRILTMLLLCLSLIQYQLIGFSIAMTITGLIYWVLSTIVVTSILNIRLKEIIGSLYTTVITGVVAYCSISIVSYLAMNKSYSVIMTLLVEVVIGLLSIIIWFFILCPKNIRKTVLQQIGSRLSTKNREQTEIS